jgi:hypothetical protein
VFSYIAICEEADAHRERVGGHVDSIGKQCHRAESYARDDFTEHGNHSDNNDYFGLSLGGQHAILTKAVIDVEAFFMQILSFLSWQFWLLSCAATAFNTVTITCMHNFDAFQASRVQKLNKINALREKGEFYGR